MELTILPSGDPVGFVLISGLRFWGAAFLERPTFTAGAFGVGKDSHIFIRSFDRATSLIHGLDLSSSCVGLAGATGLPVFGDLSGLNPALGR